MNSTRDLHVLSKAILADVAILIYGYVSHIQINEISISMALQPFVGPWPIFQFRNVYTVGRTPWTGDQPVTRPLPTHTTTQTQFKRTHRHTCLEWDLNPRPQC
jgi:hypothetical protein